MRYPFLTLLAITLLVGGCVRTTHPLLKDEQVTANDALLGKWVSADGKTSAELSPVDTNHYKLAYVSDDHKTGHFLIRFGKIGQISVAELSADAFSAGSNDESKSLIVPLYFMMVIEKTQPQLMLTCMSVDWFDKYIKANPDELEVMKVADQDGIINSSTEEFQAFFIRHLKDPGMLARVEAYVRPGDPTTQPAK